MRFIIYYFSLFLALTTHNLSAQEKGNLQKAVDWSQDSSKLMEILESKTTTLNVKSDYCSNGFQETIKKLLDLHSPTRWHFEAGLGFEHYECRFIDTADRLCYLSYGCEMGGPVGVARIVCYDRRKGDPPFSEDNRASASKGSLTRILEIWPYPTAEHQEILRAWKNPRADAIISFVNKKKKKFAQLKTLSLDTLDTTFNLQPLMYWEFEKMEELAERELPEFRHHFELFSNSDRLVRISLRRSQFDVIQAKIEIFERKPGDTSFLEGDRPQMRVGYEPKTVQIWPEMEPKK